ncbi:MAG: hypothetical protein OK449_05255 [Thaumarchaeota archaeon]|nr:hypothetical protein [Nitrososphaerota archaeon]
MAQGKINFGLSFLALLSFTAAFFTARIFTTINPDTVVVSGGVHFHHFWYGLGMVVVAGWLGIAWTRPAWRRAYAVVFGFGGGLIGDEVGLLLTFGNYHSQLTYVFFVGFFCFVTLAILVVRFRQDIERDLLDVEKGETTAHVGLAITCCSALPFAFGFLLAGSALALGGVALVAVGLVVRGRRKIERSLV